VIVVDGGELYPMERSMRASMGPNRLKLVRKFVRDGGSFAMIGGYATFTGRHNAGNWKGMFSSQKTGARCFRKRRAIFSKFDFHSMPRQWNISRLAPRSRHHLELDFDVKIPFSVLRGNSGRAWRRIRRCRRLAARAKRLGSARAEWHPHHCARREPAGFCGRIAPQPGRSRRSESQFPGARDGSVSTRLARLILDEFIDGAAAMLLLHGWSKEALVLPYGEYPIDDSEMGRNSRDCAHHLGFEYLHPYRWPEGVLGNSAPAMGVAAVETEIGGRGTITAAGQALSRQIILRFLDFTEDWRSCDGGAQVGLITDLHGVTVQELRAPVAGIVAILRTFASVQPGDRLVRLFFPKSAM
jgi:hypothetical protein